MKRNCILVLAILSTFYYHSKAQVSLIKDINTSPAGLEADNVYNHQRFCKCGGKLYFSLTNELGSELWQTDGTENGTRLVIDLNKYSFDGFFGNMICFNDKLIFAGDDGVTGTNLWSTNGTEQGTFMIKNLGSGVFGSVVTALRRAGDHIMFSEQFTNQIKVWKSDGTSSGTSPVAILEYSDNFFQIVNGCGGNYYYFSIMVIPSDFSEINYQLWRSDGTEIGTILLLETDHFIANMTPVGDKVYFGLNNDLWVTDGTPENTIKVKSMGVNIQGLFAFNDKIVFSASYELWISDGTEQGTYNLLTPGPISAGRTFQGEFYGVGYNYMISTNFMIRTDGTPEGTTQLALGSVPAPGATIGGELQMIDDRFIFALSDNTRGIEPGITDGTEEGTSILKDIFPGTESSKPRSWTAMDGKVYFLANDGLHGYEIWVTDGTTDNTYLLKDSKPETDDAFTHHSNFIKGLNNNRLLFVSGQDFSRTVWSTDGTEAGTSVALELTGINRILGSDGLYLYLEESGNLVRTEGENTEVIKNIGSQGGGPIDYSFTTGSKFYFQASTPANGDEYWVTDGTTDGTFMLKDINPGSASSLTQSLAAVFNEKFIFSANDGTNGIELWMSDGTTDGTLLLKDINHGTGNSNPSHFASLNDLLLFSADDGTHGSELWRTDGTQEGTVMVLDIATSGGSSPKWMRRVGNKVFFTAYDDANGWSLWFTDGTSENTMLIKDIIPGNDPNKFPESLTSVGSKLYFVADDGVHGKELWISDGTEEGTHVLEINEGDAGSSPTLLTNINDILYFKTEGSMWRTDGTLANTMMVAEMEPLSLYYFDGYIYFTAHSTMYGKELFRIPFTKFDQTITFLPIPEKIMGDAPFMLNAHTTSGTSVTFSSPSSTITLDGKTVEIVAPGRATITASAEATPFYNAAEEITETFCIKPVKPVVSVSDETTPYPTLTSSSHEGSSWFLNGTLIATNEQSIEATESGVYTLQITIDDCVSEMSDGVNLVITSSESETRSVVLFTPNPTTDYLNIYSASACTLRIMDLRGQVLSSLYLQGDSAVNHFVGNYTPGLYLLQMTTHTSTSTYRFIKK